MPTSLDTSLVPNRDTIIPSLSPAGNSTAAQLLELATKTDVGLGNVENFSRAEMAASGPIASAIAEAVSPLNILIITQSNFGVAPQDADVDPSPLVKIYSNNGVMEEWDITSTPISWNNTVAAWPYHFTKHIAEFFNREVNIVFDGENGSELEAWLPGGHRRSGLYTEITGSGLGEFHLVLFAQGEQNSKKIAAGAQTWNQYRSLVEQLQSELITAGAIKEMTPWLVMEQATGGMGSFNNELWAMDVLNQYWPTLPPPFSVIPCKDRPTLSDGVHYTADSLLKIGRVDAVNALFGGGRQGASQESSEGSSVRDIYDLVDARSLLPSRVLDLQTNVRNTTAWSYRGYIDAGSVAGVGMSEEVDGSGELGLNSISATSAENVINTNAGAVGACTMAVVVHRQLLGGVQQGWMANGVAGGSETLDVYSNGSNVGIRYGSAKTTLLETTATFPRQETFMLCVVKDGTNSKIYFNELEVASFDGTVLPDVQNLRFMNAGSLGIGKQNMFFYAGFLAAEAYTPAQVGLLLTSYQQSLNSFA